MEASQHLLVGILTGSRRVDLTEVVPDVRKKGQIVCAFMFDLSSTF